MKKVEFTGRIGGDGECFFWTEVSEKDKKAIIGKQNYETDRKLEEETQREIFQMQNVEFDEKLINTYMSQLYPGDVMCVLGIERDKKYKFTIIAEEINE